ncbi:MAG: cellulase family glycosylhydrolase [Saprospiraceae bacterium]
MIKIRLALALIFYSMILLHHAKAQDTPFRRGVNLTNWFQAGNVRQIQFTKYTKKDFENIKSLGCDVIRLPINLHFMTDGAPNYNIDPLFYTFLDQVVNWAEELQIHLILDNHTFDPAANTDPNVGIILEKVWKQMAAHYKDRSNYIYYEVLNEPHGIADALWNSIQQSVVTAIRTIDTKHTIIVGPAGWNSYNNLAAMPVYNDTNLIYTFHFYDPFVFTHQGATWGEPSMAALANVPFPYNATKMPVFPAALRGTWVESAFNNYQNDGTVAKVKQLIDIAVQFKQSRNVKIFCGEFGVYIPNSNNEDRVFWYDTVRKYLEEKGIAWTSWDYHGGFGIYNKGGNDLFEHDLNVPLLRALGFNVPVQLPFALRPDSTGFLIYTDYIENQMVEASYTNGTLDFYSTEQPTAGERCLYWTGANQYNAIGFDFKPNKDLSYLVNNNFVLDFWVRGNTPGARFDIRFVDTKTSDPNDHPWRMRVTIDESRAKWDNQWRQVRIPLKNFVEQGSWDNNTWYNPQGKFDWKAIDRLEIVSEHSALTNVKFWFDQMQVTTLTTTPVTDVAAELPIQVFPNPARDFINLESPVENLISYQIIDSLGRIVASGQFVHRIQISLTDSPAGLYVLRVSDGKSAFATQKILKL